MRVLLDTHVWIWGQLAPRKLHKRVARVLADPRTEVWLSPLSIWELSLLVEKGRFRLDRPFPEWVQRALAAVPTREAPLTVEVVIEALNTVLEHPDPADRLLLATARAYDLTFVTADRRLAATKNIAILSNL